METISRIDLSEYLFDIAPDLQITTRQRQPGAPRRVPGMTVGIIEMTEAPPHGGEMHPDGDEILCVLSGAIEVRTESDADEHTVLKAGEGCIIPKGEWHRLCVLEKTYLLHITPGPNGDHRPVGDKRLA